MQMCDTQIARACALEALFALGRTSEIYERIQKNAETDRYNLRVASFASFIAHLQKRETANKFCPNPLASACFNVSKHVNNVEDFIDKHYLIKRLSNHMGARGRCYGERTSDANQG